MAISSPKQQSKTGNESLKERKMKIEKGIPIPPKGGNRSSGAAQLLRGMEIGDSVVFPSKNRHGYYTLAKYAGIKVVVRAIPNTETVRVWRTE